jgi:hypothetical protein
MWGGLATQDWRRGQWHHGGADSTISPSPRTRREETTKENVAYGLHRIRAKYLVATRPYMLPGPAERTKASHGPVTLQDLCDRYRARLTEQCP